MERPDIGIHGITIEHLNNLREQFDCYYSHIFLGMYKLKELDHKLVKLLIWSVEKDEYLPSKEEVLKYQAEFDKERDLMNNLGEMLTKKINEK